MALQAIISDWNGTIISDRSEMPILKHMAVDIARHLLPLHPLKLLKIIKVRQELNRLHEEKQQDQDSDYVREMYQIYNQKIIKGTPMSVIRYSVENYAAGSEVRQKLDYRVLNVLRKYHDENKICGILSAGFDYGIDRILAAAGYRNSFDFLLADKLVENDGKATHLLLRIYRNKGSFLRNLLSEHQINPDKTVYIGDTEDDESCFQLVKYPVISFFAPEEFRQCCTHKYQAFAPKSGEELEEFLKKIDK